MQETVALWEKEAKLLNERRVKNALGGNQTLAAAVGAESKAVEDV